MLDDNNTLARAAETKMVLRELQDDLAACWFLCAYILLYLSDLRYAAQQVTDILRNKLHHQASQLADSFNRVKELEEEKRGSLRELLLAREEEKRHFELLITVGQFLPLFSNWTVSLTIQHNRTKSCRALGTLGRSRKGGDRRPIQRCCPRGRFENNPEGVRSRSFISASRS